MNVTVGFLAHTAKTVLAVEGIVILVIRLDLAALKAF